MLAKTTYIPGTCNIGPIERRYRTRSGVLGIIVTLAGFAGLLFFRATPGWYLLLFLPAAGATVSLLQGVMRFCVGFGLRGLVNFGALGEEVEVADATSASLDRRRSWQLIGLSIVVGAIVAAAAMAAASALG